MNLLVEVIIGLILAFLVYLGIHYFVVNQPAKRLRVETQAIVDKAVNYAVNQLNTVSFGENLTSDYNGGVWGRGVMVFEYQIDADADSSQTNLTEIKSKLETTLNQYGLNKKLEPVEGNSCFAITDMWLMDGKLYFDVAYLMNQVTLEYVDDLKRLSE